MNRRPTALIADDEPLLRKALARLLATAWPELEIVALARNGREAVERFEALQPDICFLDVHMPGLSGVEAAQQIGRRAQLVFVTAYDNYAVQAFQHGALDYLMKPVDSARLADTVARLQERLRAAQPRPDTDALLEELAVHLRRKLGLGQPSAASDSAPVPVPEPQPAAVASSTPTAPLRWLRAAVGQAVRLIAVDDIDYLRSDEKYTRIAWRGDGGKAAEALVRTPLKELLPQLDPAQFAQVHRSVVVNLRAISHVVRGENETADIHLKHRAEVLPVSRSYLGLFRQM
ncbi:LytTR family two component transcriptional regulator [Tahibacter aquaticus]|uniref:LytTR family two component transcriptional regulator n=1 Tax=Tahibacter aquaticus TaxID=520092 RepID=A0A4R6Z4J4_9GAMM|nr:LytTR family DNA-binding domain-containing protein [Tahibacter aquaticus]TDR46595.1 LytTR family two component transcriptional regulator [Tahibacter aquaticus]